MKRWTHETIALLKAFWAEGYTAAQIAAMLGGVSPNAVGGKIYRMGLPKRREAKRARVRVAKLLAVPCSLNVSLVDLAPSLCRWPEDRPESVEAEKGSENVLEGRYVFCGHPNAPGYSYCPAHAQIAYRAEPGGIVVRKIDRQLAEAA